MCFIWILMTSVMSDGYQEWKQPVKRGRMAHSRTLEAWDLLLALLLACWVTLVNQCTLLCASIWAVEILMLASFAS